MATDQVSSSAWRKSRREELAIGPVRTAPKRADSSAKITVCIRKRQLIESELRQGEIDVVQVKSHNEITLKEIRRELSGSEKLVMHDFYFDKVFGELATNRQIYVECVQSLINNLVVLGGRNSCFAFGQTSSGKTFTMLGPGPSSHLYKASEHVGLWIQAGEDCLRQLAALPEQNLKLAISFYEIHCNKAYDLLNERKVVRPLEHSNKTVVIKDLTEIEISNTDTLLQTIQKGVRARSTAANSKNLYSSRSHGILELIIRKTAREAKPSMQNFTHSRNTLLAMQEQMEYHGKLAFIDLAGSERGADSAQFGRTVQKDGAGINKSLLALKECIRAMDRGTRHIPFRDSELTKILREYFTCAQAFCVMIATLSAGNVSCEQTLNTLRYAQRFIALRASSNPTSVGNTSNVRLNSDDQNSESIMEEAGKVTAALIRESLLGENAGIEANLQAKCDLPIAVTSVAMRSSTEVPDLKPTDDFQNLCVPRYTRAIDAVRNLRPVGVKQISNVLPVSPLILNTPRATSLMDIEKFSNETNRMSISRSNTLDLGCLQLPQSYLQTLNNEVPIGQLKIILNSQLPEQKLRRDSEIVDMSIQSLEASSPESFARSSRSVSEHTMQSYENLLQTQAVYLRDIVALSTVHIRLCRLMETNNALAMEDVSENQDCGKQIANIDLNSVKICQELLKREFENLQSLATLFKNFELNYNQWQLIQTENQRRSQASVEMFPQ